MWSLLPCCNPLPPTRPRPLLWWWLLSGSPACALPASFAQSSWGAGFLSRLGPPYPLTSRYLLRKEWRVLNGQKRRDISMKRRESFERGKSPPPLTPRNHAKKQYAPRRFCGGGGDAFGVSPIMVHNFGSTPQNTGLVCRRPTWYIDDGGDGGGVSYLSSVAHRVSRVGSGTREDGEEKRHAHTHAHVDQISLLTCISLHISHFNIVRSMRFQWP